MCLASLSLPPVPLKANVTVVLYPWHLIESLAQEAISMCVVGAKICMSGWFRGCELGKNTRTRVDQEGFLEEAELQQVWMEDGDPGKMEAST